jgi:hypothetical protein
MMAMEPQTLPEITPHKTAELVFDAQNPRIRELFREQDEPPTQDEILEILWREFSVSEVALSIAANGFFKHEPIFIAFESGQWVVIEGNRRLAAVRLLQDEGARRRVGATDLPRISVAARQKLAELPTIECTRKEIWQYVGFKHVNGPQAWQSLAKAEYIAWVHNNLDITLEEISSRIGDLHSTVRRLYRALMAVEQAEDAAVFDRNDRWQKHFSFSHLYTGLDYAGIQKFTGILGEKSFQRRPIPQAKVKEFGELCLWLYGSKAASKPPVIQSQNPDLRILDEVLATRDGLAALRRGLPLRVSLDISKGDDRLLREALIDAKRALQEARGRVLTGFNGESDLLDLGEDIRTLAIDIQDEMVRLSSAEAPKRRTRVAR